MTNINLGICQKDNNAAKWWQEVLITSYSMDTIEAQITIKNILPKTACTSEKDMVLVNKSKRLVFTVPAEDCSVDEDADASW